MYDFVVAMMVSEMEPEDEAGRIMVMQYIETSSNTHTHTEA